MLEQTLEMYQTGISRQRQAKTYFVVVNLEYLSASALYSSKPLGGSGPLEFSDIPMFGHTQSMSSGPLTIRPFSGFELHIHEGAGGTGHIKYPDGTKELLDSIDAAIADLHADELGIPRYIKLDKCKRTGRI